MTVPQERPVSMTHSVPRKEGKETPLLEAQGIVKTFGTFTALDNVDFDLFAGEIHALLGENGAGKSTLMNILSGLLRPTQGTLRCDGEVVSFSSPSDAEARGIGMVHQHFLLVPTLSVRENLLLGASRSFGGLLSYPMVSASQEVQTLAERLGWTIPWNALAGSLPVGTQQRIEILKALRGDTRILIFDEPTAVLTPTETPELFATIRRLAQEGRGIVFISHKLNEVQELAGRVTVLRRGKVVHRTTTWETDAAGLAQAMVGVERTGELSAQEHLPPSPPTNSGYRPAQWDRAIERKGQSVPAPFEVEAQAVGNEQQTTQESVTPPTIARLQVNNLTVGATGGRRPRLNNITFAVASGEIFGIAGVDGNGQTELAECLSGLLRPESGTMTVEGNVLPFHPAAFRHAGVAVIPADRQKRGLALPMTITENITFGVYDRLEFRRGPVLLWSKLRERASQLIADFDIRATGPGALAASLSGGNQQKVVIARALSDNPRIVVAVNPTRGLDVGAIGYVHSALRTAQAAGAAIVLISTELDEVLKLSDRVAVLYEGAFSGIVPPDTPREQIGLLMGGRTQ